MHEFNTREKKNPAQEKQKIEEQQPEREKNREKKEVCRPRGNELITENPPLKTQLAGRQAGKYYKSTMRQRRNSKRRKRDTKFVTLI